MFDSNPLFGFMVKIVTEGCSSLWKSKRAVSLGQAVQAAETLAYIAKELAMLENNEQRRKTVKFMGREEARAKAWNTFRESVYQYAREHPEYPLGDIILQRMDVAYSCWRDARLAERHRDFRRARGLYLKASKSLEQAEKLADIPAASLALEKSKAEYYNFVVTRDPIYRAACRSFFPSSG
jgi:hypothetical protein